jgi:transcriptional regulator with XRE-family HTH domain
MVKFFHRAIHVVMERFEGTDMKAIGLRLLATRLALGFDQQKKFCDRAEIATNTYNQYEQGERRPAVENAIALCDAYDLTLDWIYRGDPSGLRYDLRDKIKETRVRMAKSAK